MPPKNRLAPLRHLRLIVKKAVGTLQSGSLPSIFKGSGLTFDEVRHYQPGDDVRAIDWNVTARMGQPFVKRFVEERELRILFVLDLSASLTTGMDRFVKHDVAAELMALLALAGLRYGDSMGLVTFTSQIESYLAPRRGMRHACKLIYQALYQQPEQSETDIGKALQFAARVSQRRSAIVVLSDFLDQNWQNAMDRLAHRHDVYAMCIRDKLEENLPGAAVLHLTDAETGRTMYLDSAHTEIGAASQDIARYRVHWLSLSTDGSHAEKLVHSLSRLRLQHRVLR